MQSEYEYEPVTLYRINEENRLITYTQPFRVAMVQYLNQIAMFNESGITDSDLMLPTVFLRVDPTIYNGSAYEETSLTQKSEFFLITNGLRDLRVKSLNATLFQQSTAFI
jgi:hypothetical protein